MCGWYLRDPRHICGVEVVSEAFSETDIFRERLKLQGNPACFLALIQANRVEYGGKQGMLGGNGLAHDDSLLK